MRTPSLTRQNDKVLIVAYGESMDKTPWEDETFDLYTLNAAHRLFDPSRASLWFQMHRPGSGEGHIDDQDHVRWLASWRGAPVLMLDKLDSVPASVAYPLQEVTANCGPGRHFYSSSIDYMAAYALYQGYSEIHLYGVDMVTPDYQARKHSLGYYLGVARGRGVGVYLPEESSLLRHTHIYGYESEPKEHERLIKHISGFVNECDRDKQKALDESQLAYGNAREQEGMRKAYRNIIEVLKLRDYGSTL